MGYSITFGIEQNCRNTWTDWKLVPESPPVIPSPKPKTNYVDIPGRAKGPLDLSKEPFDRQTYERITGTWTFVMYEDYWNTPNRNLLVNQIRGWLHGRVTRMKLEEEPNFLYYGRFTMEPPKAGMGPFAVQIGFDLEPVRFNLDGTADMTWLTDVADWAESGPIIPPEGYGITPISDEQIHDLFH